MADIRRNREAELDRERRGVLVPVYALGRFLPVAHQVIRCPPREHFPPRSTP